jgi:dihydropyrimidinase
MADFDLVVRQAQVATAADVFSCDIGIRGERIAALGNGLTAPKVIDAAGRWVTPGGVDGHCHFDQPTSDGSIMADDFLSGTVSAAHGGTTTIIPFACQFRGHSLAEAIEDYHRRAAGKAVIDYAFHLIISDPTTDVLASELPRFIAEGYSHFKIYMTYDDLKLGDRQILDVLKVARGHGAMVMIHAENSECIAWLTEQLEAAGQTRPHHHASSRPPVIEREATHRAIALAELMDVPILIVHVSGRDAAEEIRRAQARGLRIYGETCPQYLFLTADDLRHDGYEGAKCVCSPPPRTRTDQEYLWRALAGGTFSLFSSDHAPFRYDDPTGKALGRPKGSFRWIPNGVPGVETRLALLFSAGVLDNRIDIRQFVALTSTNPARMYGLYPRKGTIAVGGDADLVIWDTSRRFTLTNARLHHAVDYTPYEGIELGAWPAIVLSRGQTIVSDGVLTAAPGRGRFLPSAKPDPARPLRPDDPHPWLTGL